MVKTRLISLFLLSILTIGINGNADAQFWKKKKSRRHEHKHKHEEKNDAIGESRDKTESEREKKKEQRRKEKKERRKLKHERKLSRKKGEVAKPKTVAAPVVKNKVVTYPATTMKQRYRIDVLSPLYLDEVAKGAPANKNNIPEKSQPGIAFYEGIKIAADSLKKAGYNIDIYIHDVTSAAESPNALISKRMLDSSNLIIGAVLAKDIPPLAEYAKKKRINFVSALSPGDGNVKDNEYFTLLQPSLKSHCEWITGDIKKKFPRQRTVLLYRSSLSADDNAYKYIMESAGSLELNQFLCSAFPHKKELARIFDTTHPNVVIVPVLDVAFADSILKELSADFPATHFEVYGMPSWASINNLHKSSSYPNLSINITYPYNFDSNTPLGQYISHTCKREYGNNASELVFRGYETLYWYAYLLKQYGTIFNTHYADNSTAPFTRFDIKTQWDNAGHLLYNENKHMFLSTYEGGNNRTE